MADPDDKHQKLVVVDLVDDPVVADPDPPSRFARRVGKADDAGRSRIHREVIDGRSDSALNSQRQVRELPPGSRREVDSIPVSQP